MAVSMRMERAAQALRDAIAAREQAREQILAGPSMLQDAWREELVRRAGRYLEAVAREHEALRLMQIARRIELRERPVPARLGGG